jgi:uncharacterized cupredoxin-like copper-binding protein
MKQELPSLIAGLALATLSAAHAHGDEKHAGPAVNQGYAASAAYSGHAAALGEPGQGAKVTRVIRVRMGDNMRFDPPAIVARRGETVRLEVSNAGAIKHELVLGTPAELREHAAQMQKHPEMEHDDPNAVSVPPGEMRSLVWRFSKSGRFEFACLVPGRYEAGMVGRVNVQAR